MPSHRMVSGIQVIEGNGRSSDTNGSTMAFAGHHTAITTPNGTETSAASAKPANTRSDEISTELHKSPLAISSCAWATIWPGDGRNSGEITPVVVASCHASTKQQTDAILISRLAETCARDRRRCTPSARIATCVSPFTVLLRRHEAGILPLRHVRQRRNFLVVVQPLRQRLHLFGVQLGMRLP